MSLQQIPSPPPAAAEVIVNENFAAVSATAVYAKRATASVGLTWGYYGGRWGGFAVPDGTLTLTDSATNYIVVASATGVPSVASSATNWNDADAYTRVYKVTTSGGIVTGVEDHRAGPGGIIGGGAAGSISPESLGLVIGEDVQAYDADLTAIAGLTATTDSFMQAKSSAWAARTVAQVLVDLQGDGLTATMAGFRGIPQNSQSADYTLVASDAGKHIYHPAADTTARTWTIPANGSVAFPIGTAITFDNDFGAGAVTIAITTDTLVLVGAAGSTGGRTLASGGQATAVKVTSTRWRISGTGLS